MLTAQIAAPASPASIEGIWRSSGGNSIIKIALCGDNPCGTVMCATDQAKKDSSKSTEQLVGTQLLANLQQDKKGRWEGNYSFPTGGWG